MTVREFGMLVIGMGIISVVDIVVIYRNNWYYTEREKKLKDYFLYKNVVGFIIVLFGFCFLLAMGK